MFIQWIQKRKKLSLKTAYYLSFLFLIVVPVLIILLISLLVLNNQFRKQAVANIRQVQEVMAAELVSDIDGMSMRLSHLVHSNDNEILDYAAKLGNSSGDRQYAYEQQLRQAGNLALEPLSNIISVAFYMKDGQSFYMKNEIRRTVEELRKMGWYQKALQEKNRVCLGTYNTETPNDLYAVGKKNLLVLAFALAPGVDMDRSQEIEMVVLYQTTDVSKRIEQYNREYMEGENKQGITQICDEEGEVIYSTMEEETDFGGRQYICVRTPVELNGTVWYLESHIKTRELTGDYWSRAYFILAAAIAVLALAGYYFRYFLRDIINPIEEISEGLLQVENGNLEVYVSASGQSEVRNMIHQFNAMVRRLKALIGEYEKKMRSVEYKPADYLAALMKREITAKEAENRSADFFTDPYVLLAAYITYESRIENDMNMAVKLQNSFEKNPIYASHCFTYIENSSLFLIMYQVREGAYRERITGMIRELQKTTRKEFKAGISVCIGRKASGADDFILYAEDIKRKICLRHLYGENALIDLEENSGENEKLLELSKEYEKLANALYIADEKNMLKEREKLFAVFSSEDMQESRRHAWAVILAIGCRFDLGHTDFSDVFGMQHNYLNKIGKIEDRRSLQLWFTNYFAWLTDYSASRLNMAETDVIIRAKRYMADRYDNPDLSLTEVAEQAGLNEKYFTSRFTKETGETFSSYLTELRMQKARELLKTTSFKIYEISEMVGYRNAEHFNRMFKKLYGMTPAQYRKSPQK